MQNTKDSAGSISDEGYAERLSKQCRCEDDGQAKTFIIPLNEVLRTESFCCFSYGEQSKAYQHHKVIMLVGATGVGKSTLINAMVNYILGVKWEDDFRFKIVDKRVEGPQSQAHSQTQVITSYTIHSNEHHTIPYTLTIIDTPGFGDTRGVERDKAIVHQVKEFFSHPEDHHVDHLDVVGFVANSTEARLTPTQKYIFDSILGLYGTDIEPNIIIFATFCNTAPPEFISAFKEENIRCEGNLFKFNNSALFACNMADEDDVVPRTYYKKGMKNIESFFKSLDQMEPVSLFLTKKVLHERIRLENISKHLNQQIHTINVKACQLQKEMTALEHHKSAKEQNRYVHIPTYVTIYEQVNTEGNAMNCTACGYTCHFPCLRRKKSNYWCCAFDIRGRCTVCPKKCKTSDHAVQSVIIVPRSVKQKVTFGDVTKRYQSSKRQELSVEQVIQKLKVDIQEQKNSLDSLHHEATRCVQRLQEIALQPQISVNEYIDLLIEKEKKRNEIGWKDGATELKLMKLRDEAFLSLS